MREIQISKHDLRVTRVVEGPSPPLAAGMARLKLELFGLTSNNITYATMGEGALGYWDFFPGPDGWGRPPVWGFATVVASSVIGVDEGARYYGYFPLAESVDVVPMKVGPRGFIDGAPHRATKAAVYNQYFDTRTDPAYDPVYECEQVVFRPLYGSGWWAADRVHQAGPRTVVISSASSKTAMATTLRLRQLGDADRVALTSTRHLAFVRETGLYQQTLSYDELDTLSVRAPAIYVDFLGRDDVTAAVHRSLGSDLAHSILVGATDWSAKPGGVQQLGVPVVGPTPEFLMVPHYAPQRLQTDPALGAAILRDLRAFYEGSREFVTVRRMTGIDSIVQGWATLVAGEATPREGLALSF